ncbi:MAG: DUF484 family protein [Betaproteobacteria bacterium]|nr:MAG: DUF484 family protein [Betaproteobacteria bacterium]
MKAEEVAQFLNQHPEFFEDYAEMLAEVVIPHPHGGRAIPISERQILSLREKSRRLESKLGELIRFGEQNDAITDKLHRITIALIGARDVAGVLHVLGYNLREDFAVPHVAVRLWNGFSREAPSQDEVGADARAFADGLNGPYCSAHAMADTAAWFGEAAAHLRSFAYVPLRDERTFGLLALASEDPQRFYPEMGTLYLRRLGDVAAAALLRNRAP